MTGALLYQPRQRWRIGFAFGAAALLHFAAVALASIHQQEKVDGPLIGASEFPVVEVEDIPSHDEPPLPEVTAPTPIPEWATDSSFPDERPTPPPVHRQEKRPTAPFFRKTGTNIPGSLSSASATVLALSAPRPAYPYEARRQKITGDGIVTLNVDPSTGRVVEVAMWKSTGNAFLDNAALTGFRRWRFRPGTVSTLKCPITFTLAGASY
ncbi:MAG: hypothetical protein DLM73_10190 [Chthoniobacterales bacterium]|nr:MAG: hypothetical protein DLM73_10190 [Chthoniobacterales bacterium]